MPAKRTDPSAQAVTSGVPEGAWRKLHPLTPISKIGAVLAVLLGWALLQNFDLIRDIVTEPEVAKFGLTAIILVAIAALLLVSVLVGAYSYVAWRHAGFAITDQAVYYRAGIFFRSQTHARLSRIQSVNIKYGFVGRLLGLGHIDIEVAGGADSSLSFGLLTKADLEGVRREVMTQVQAARSGASVAHTEVVAADPAGGADPGAATVSTSGVEIDASGEGGFDYQTQGQVIYRIPPARLLASILADHHTVLMFVVALALLTGTMIHVVLRGFSFASLPTAIAGFSVFGFAWNRFSSDYGYTASVTPDGIRVEAGLVSTRSQTFPPQRIHGLRVSQPLLWRYFGWYRLEVSQAGFRESDETSNQASSVLLPVGTREQMELAMWLVFPDLGVTDPIGMIQAGMEGDRRSPAADTTPAATHPNATAEEDELRPSDHPQFVANPLRSRIFDPLAYRRRALAISPTHLFWRDGWFTRSLIVVPHARLQGVSVKSGPWARRRGLVTLRGHLAGDPTSVIPELKHLDAATGAVALEQIRLLALVQHERESLAAWRHRVSQSTQRGFIDAQPQPVETAELIQK